MATKNRPGNCFENSRDDEPIFILAARDKTAPAAVRAWADTAAAMGVSPSKTVGARQVAIEMEVWQQENPDLVKVPA